MNEAISIEGFNTIFRKDRNAFGGGVLVYISDELRVKRRVDLEPCNTECIWVEISGPTCNIFLCCIYRAPNSDKSFWNNMSWSVEKASDLSNKVIIVGDLNIDFLNIPRSHVINGILLDYHMMNIIQHATRITQKTSTLIDPILITDNFTVFDSGTIEVDGSISDHRGTYVYIKSNIDFI